MASGTIRANRVLLWSGSLTGTGSVTLSEPYTNFGFIMVCWDVVGVLGRSFTFSTTASAAEDGVVAVVESSGAVSYYAQIDVSIHNGTTFSIDTNRKKPDSWGSNNVVTAIYGIR